MPNLKVGQSYAHILAPPVRSKLRVGQSYTNVLAAYPEPQPIVDVLFVGYLNADDTLELNSAGLELTIDPASGTKAASTKMKTSWDGILKKLDRLIPRPVFSIDCPKMVYGTGQGAAVDCNADMPSNLITDTVLQMNGVVISGTTWGTQANNYFAQGLIIYTATDPVNGLDFTFTLNVQASLQRGTSPVYGDLYCEMFPPLMSVGTVVQAYRGCDRTRNTCQTAFIPAGSVSVVPGTFTPGTLRVTVELFSTLKAGGGTQQPVTAKVYITATTLWIVYNRNNTNQIGDIFIGPGTAVPWDPTWAVQGSTIITSPKFNLAANSLVGPPAVPGYHIVLSNNSATAKMYQQPTAGNGYVTVVECPGGSPGIFDFTVAWVANGGTAVTIGNLQNFGGTDIPIQHPSLETAA